MNDAKRYCIMQSVVGSITSNMQMQKKTCVPQMSGFAGESVCVYGKVGNFHGLACVISPDAEYHNGRPINGEMRARTTGQWQVAQ